MLNQHRNSGHVPDAAESRNLRILVSDPVEKSLVEGLEERGYPVDYRPGITPGELEECIQDYEAIVLRSRTKLYRRQLSLARNLRYIARAGIGTDNIDTGTAASMGIEVITAAGSSTQSVVELNVALAINLARNIVNLSAGVREGGYRKDTGLELGGKTAGIIGFGRIGSSTARVLAALGMHILAYDILKNPKLMGEIGGRYVELDTLLEESDFVFVLLTLGKESLRILGTEEFGIMRRGCHLINTSRAEAVDPEALLGALESGDIAGYAGDVLWNEPPSTMTERKLIGMKNVIITPHIGAQTREAQKRVAAVTLANLLEAMEAKA